MKLYFFARAWVNLSNVFLLSKEPPNTMRKGTGGFRKAMDELQLHIQNIKLVQGNYKDLDFSVFQTEST